jgi:hypothetical protein
MEGTMSDKRIGRLPPRYSFILNPYPDERLSKCPICEKLTHTRKFALFIHIDGFGPLVLGKTCRYCSLCEVIIAHQDELEAELAHSFSKLDPGVIGNEYLVVGTVEKAEWQHALQGKGKLLSEMMDHVADFKKVLELHIEPACWQPAKR